MELLARLKLVGNILLDELEFGLLCDYYEVDQMKHKGAFYTMELSLIGQEAIVVTITFDAEDNKKTRRLLISPFLGSDWVDVLEHYKDLHKEDSEGVARAVAKELVNQKVPQVEGLNAPKVDQYINTDPRQMTVQEGIAIEQTKIMRKQNRLKKKPKKS